MAETAQKVVLITGAARRVGAGLARDLARAGWSVALHYRSGEAEAKSLATELETLGVKARTFYADLEDEAQCASLIPAVVDQMGRIDALINNASRFSYDTLDSLTPASWQAHLASNLTAPILLIRAFAKAIEAQGTKGVVINILDHKIDSPNPDFFSYTVGKVGLAGMTRTLALALAPQIRVCGIAPGLILRSGDQTEAEYRAAWHDTPLGIGVSLEDVARTARFILDTPSLTGQNITLDAGETLVARGRDVAFDDTLLS